MQEPNLSVLRHSVPLWIGAGLLIALDALAASLPLSRLTYVALACSGAYALYGVGFGIWAGRQLSKSR